MPASQEQKVDFLLKKIGYSASKTGIAEDSSLSGSTKKAPFAEAIPSPLIIPSSSLWSESGFIPTTPPSSNTAYVGIYTAANAYQMTFDNTVGAARRTFIARSSYGNQSSSIDGDWIDTQFGADYIVKVYKGDPNSGGVSLQQAGANAETDGWFFDYSSGVLNFNGDNLPSGIGTDNVYILGYRYIGRKGIQPPAGIGTFHDLVVSNNLSVGGISTFNGDVNVATNAKIKVGTGLTFYFDGTNTLYSNTSNVLHTIENSGQREAWNSRVSGIYVPSFKINHNSAVEAYYANGDIKFSTSGIGITVYGQLDTTTLNVTGVSTFGSLINANGKIVGIQTDNVIPFYYDNTGDFPSAATYHGAFAHAHNTGKAYFAHAGWKEIISKEATGVVGTGTEIYHIGDLNVTGITTLGSIGISTGRITGPAITYIDPASVGDDTGTLVVKGNLQVEGTQTVVNSSTMTVADKNIELAKGAANDAAVDGAGITIDSGDGDKTWQWVDATDSWTSSEHIRIPDNKVIGFATDTNTFISRPAADTIAFTHGGSEKVRITSNGDVGIGSTSPGQKLDVTGNIRTRSNDNTAQFEHNALKFQTSGGAHVDHETTNQNLNFRVTKSSTSDTNMMQIHAASEQTKFRKIITVGLQGGGDTTQIGGGSGIGAYLQLNYANNNIVNTKLLGNNNSWLNSHYGNLGIGTQTATRKLQVTSSSADPYIKIGGSGRDCGLMLDANNEFVALRTDAADRLWVNAKSDAINFTVGGTSTANTKLRIKSDGSVGIGTYNPITLLDVRGSVGGFDDLRAPHSDTVKTYTVTVATKDATHRYPAGGDSSSNGYKIDGEFSPFITLTPGRTYRFDQSDSSNATHQIKFYLEADKTTLYEGGVTYNGTAGSSGAYTQIVVGDETPIVLHYQCINHGYMGNAVQVNSNVVNTNYDAFLRGNFKIGTGTSVSTILDEDNMASDSASALVTQQSIKKYVDDRTPQGIGGGALSITADDGGNTSINLATETLDIEGTANEIVTATGAGITANTVVIGLPDNVTIGNNLTVNNDVGISSNLNVTGISTFNALNVTGISTFNDNVVVQKDKEIRFMRFTDLKTRIEYNDTLNVTQIYNFADNLEIGYRPVKLNWLSSTVLQTKLGGVNVTGETETDTLNTGDATFTGTISAGSTTGTDGYYLKSVGTGVTWAQFPTVRTGLTTTATAGQTTFNFSYNVGFVDVFVNGVKLPSSEFTANNGSTIVLDDAAFANDTLEFISLNTVPGSSSGGASNLTGLADVTISGTPVIGETLQHNGSEFVNDFTVSATTTSTSQTAISSLPIATYRSVEYTIQVTEGTKYHVTKVLAIHDGTNVTFNEFGTLTTSTSLSTFALDINSGNMRLLATPASTNSTVFKVKFTGIKV